MSLSENARLLTQYFVDQDCHEILFETQEFGEFMSQGCASQAVSKLLGYGIVAGSMMVKVPQILKMTGSRSSEGISSTSNALDLLMVGATMAYGYSKNMPFAAYGDATFVYAQTAIILLLIPFFRGNYALTLVYMALAMGAAFAVFNNLIGLEFITIAQQANIPLTVISRGIQIITNFSNKSAGQLSGITFFLSFAGCASRIFTSLVDAKDNLMALSFAVSTVLNGLVWGQILYYSGAKKDKKE